MEIGDRVIVNGEYSGIEFKDEAGRIIGFANGDVCVEFDNYINGYSYCSVVETKSGHCWFVSPKMIKKEETMKERIEALEKEIAALKACQKYAPERGRHVIRADSKVYEENWADIIDDCTKVGRAFDTKEKAVKARDIMVKHDIILKYVIDHAPDYEFDA